MWLTTQVEQKLHQALPKIAGLPTHLLTFKQQQWTLEKVLNYAFEEAIAEGDTEFLNHRILRIHIEDAGINIRITQTNNSLALLPSNGPDDASIRGNLSEFILIASRHEDPDTLFFQRRLCLEGDTELSLEVKNLIDSLDLNSLPYLIKQALNMTGHWQQRKAEAT